MPGGLHSVLYHGAVPLTQGSIRQVGNLLDDTLDAGNLPCVPLLPFTHYTGVASITPYHTCSTPTGRLPVCP